MAVPENFLRGMSLPADKNHLKEMYDEFQPFLLAALKQVEKNHQNVFNAQDYEVYLHGSLVNGVQVEESNHIEVMVEINEAAFNKVNEKVYGENIGKIKSQQRYEVPELKNELFDALQVEAKRYDLQLHDQTIFVPQTKKFGAEVDISIAYKRLPENEPHENLKTGIYSWSALEKHYYIMYPKSHTENIEKKNKETKGYFKRIVRIFRWFKLILIENKVIAPNEAPGYFIDCLLYNVPNELYVYRGNYSEIVLKILNYLNLCNLVLFKCAHEQFEMFGQEINKWKIKDGRIFILSLIYMWHQFELDN